MADDGRPVAVLEQGYADHFDLQDQVADRQRRPAARPVGTGTSPQHFIVTGSRGMLFAEAGFATVFVPLHTAQQLLGRSGQVNEVVLRVSDAADLATLQREVSAALPGAGLSFTRRAEEPAVRMLYEDIDNDQQFWNVIAGLVLAGLRGLQPDQPHDRRPAPPARRGDGAGHADPPAGGGRCSWACRSPSSAWWAWRWGTCSTSGSRRVHLGPAVADLAHAVPAGSVRPRRRAGTGAPVLAAALPVWRALRVEPVEAIRTGHLAFTGAASSG